VREITQLPGFEVVDDKGEWKEITDATAMEKLAKVLAGTGAQEYEIGNNKYEARRERDASGVVSFTQTNLETKKHRELRLTPSIFAWKTPDGAWEPVRDASAAFVYTVVTGEPQTFQRYNDVYITEVDTNGVLFQRNMRTQMRRRVRQLVPGTGAATSPRSETAPPHFSFQMNSGQWQQVSEAAACTAMAAVHKDGGKQKFSSSFNKAGTQYDYEVTHSNFLPTAPTRAHLCASRTPLVPCATPPLPQVRKEGDGRLVQRNVQTGTERVVRVGQNTALPTASALRLLRIGQPLALALDTVAGNPRLQMLRTGAS
jgi:hypothetical protein